MYLDKVYVTFWLQLYILYFILSIASCTCRTAIAHPYICVYKVVVVELLDYLLDITALSEFEAQAFRYTRINIC